MAIKKILDKLTGKVDSAEIFYFKGFARNVNYKGWKLHTSTAKQTEGYALRVIKDGKLGFSATTDPEDISKLVDNALTLSTYGEKTNIKFPDNSSKPKEVKTYDPNVESIEQKTLIEAGQYYIDKVMKHRKTCDMGFSASISSGEMRIMNTEGLDISDKGTSLSLSGDLARVKEGDVFFVGERFASRFVPENFNTEIDAIVSQFDEKLQWADNIVNISSGTHPIVFDPQGSLVMLLPLLQGIDGNAIYTKTSPIANKLGQKIFSDKLSISDDGTIDKHVGSSTYDDEGMPKKKMQIIENGVLKNFIFNLMTASKAGMEANGCGSRSLFSHPEPSTSNIIVHNGETNYKEMIADIEEGILLESVLGMGQGNILSGAFSNPMGIAYKIEKGKVVGRVKDAQIAGNIYELLKNIHSVGNDGRWFWGRFFCPHIRMDNIPIIGK